MADQNSGVRADTLSAIRRRIEALRRRFEDNPGLYLSEADLQAELFFLLHDDFGQAETVKTVFKWGSSRTRRTLPFTTRRLHTEFHLPEGRIDLAVLDLDHVLVGIGPRGRFSHLRPEGDDGNHVFIEIKASRSNRSGLDRARWAQAIRSDLEKLNGYRYFSFLLCFDFNGLLDDLQVRSLRDLAASNVELAYIRTPLNGHYLARNSDSGGEQEPLAMACRVTRS